VVEAEERVASMDERILREVRNLAERLERIEASLKRG